MDSVSFVFIDSPVKINVVDIIIHLKIITRDLVIKIKEQIVWTKAFSTKKRLTFDPAVA